MHTLPKPAVSADEAQAVYSAIYTEEILPVADKIAIFLAGDGFGRISSVREWNDRGIGWDWSHVRDSSPEGWARVLATARGLGVLPR